MRISLNEADRARFQRLVATQRQNAAILDFYSRYLNCCPRAVKANEVRQLTVECGVDDQTAYLTLFAALCGLDIAGNPDHRHLAERYLRPSIRRLTADRYRNDPYLNEIQFPNRTRGRWALRLQRYEPYEAFVRDDLIVKPDFTEIPLLGFFSETYAYPAVLEAGREWMTVTPNEIETMRGPLADAKGRVCAFGLGLGYFALLAAQKPEVSRVTVVERDPDVIVLFQDYILPQFPDPGKVQLVQADALDFAGRGLADTDYAFVDLWHDVADGVPLYCSMKKVEALSPHTRFSYWIERSLLSNLRFRLLNQMQDALAGVKEEAGFPETADWRLERYEQVEMALRDESLRRVAAGIKEQPWAL